MATKKKSFLLHIDSLDILDDLDDQQAGLLFKAIKAYQIGEDLKLDSLVKIAFSPFKNQFSRDDEKYQKTCERRADAGSKGGKQKVANASKCKQKVANVADSVNKNKNKTKSDSDSDKEVIQDIPDKPDAPKFNFKNELLSLGVDKQILDDWFEVRKAKKARNTKTAFDALIKQITESGLMVNDAIKFATEENWAGFKSAWYFNKQPAQGGAGQAKQYSDVTAQNINTIGEWLNE